MHLRRSATTIEVLTLDDLSLTKDKVKRSTADRGIKLGAGAEEGAGVVHRQRIAVLALDTVGVRVSGLDTYEQSSTIGQDHCQGRGLFLGGVASFFPLHVEQCIQKLIPREKEAFKVPIWSFFGGAFSAAT